MGTSFVKRMFGAEGIRPTCLYYEGSGAKKNVSINEERDEEPIFYLTIRVMVPWRTRFPAVAFTVIV